MTGPATLTPRPSLVLVLLGGLVATLLQTALVHLAPSFRFPFVDVPRLVGGVFVGNPTAAFWLGYGLYFMLGVFVVAPALGLTWPSLPGAPFGLPGALVRGAVWTVALWVIAGAGLPLLDALNGLTGPGLHPGFFATRESVAGAVGLLLGQLAYALALALVVVMGRGIEPIATIGWQGYGMAFREPPPGGP